MARKQEAGLDFILGAESFLLHLRLVFIQNCCFFTSAELAFVPG